jgi:recombinational DNA repair protein (RecF pathway)
MGNRGPIDAQAVLLSIQPHREDDLFLRALVRGQGVLGFHVPRGRKAGRRHAGVFQPFLLGRLHADARRVVRGIDPIPAMGASRLSRAPRRYLAAHLLTELVEPLATGEGEATSLFDLFWDGLSQLHVAEKGLPLGALLLSVIGRALVLSGLLPEPARCFACGRDLSAPDAPLSSLLPEVGFACAPCRPAPQAFGWTPPLILALADAAAGRAPAEPVEVPLGAIGALVELVERFMGRELRAYRELARSW